MPGNFFKLIKWMVLNGSIVIIIIRDSCGEEGEGEGGGPIELSHLGIARNQWLPHIEAFFIPCCNFLIKTWLSF